MKIGIMQPYLFPYIGYFQLIHAADMFVLHDDVQWIKGGWINRNRVLSDGKPLRWTLSVSKKSSYDLINQCEVSAFSHGKDHILRQMQNAYTKAPFFAEVMALVSDILHQKEKNVAKFIRYSLEQIANYVGLSTKLVMSSALKKDNSLKKQDRVIAICSTLGATVYINPPGGVSLYNKQDFKSAGIDLYFLQSGNIEYEQFGNNFVPNLSIVDVLMFNSVASVQKMLKRFTLT